LGVSGHDNHLLGIYRIMPTLKEAVALLTFVVVGHRLVYSYVVLIRYGRLLKMLG
jgi:hypothetical protein